jgi:hypothetical protein
MSFSGRRSWRPALECISIIGGVWGFETIEGRIPYHLHWGTLDTVRSCLRGWNSHSRCIIYHLIYIVCLDDLSEHVII